MTDLLNKTNENHYETMKIIIIKPIEIHKQIKTNEKHINKLRRPIF